MTEAAPTRSMSRFFIVISVFFVLFSFGVHFVSDAMCSRVTGDNPPQCGSSLNGSYAADGRISCSSIHGCFSAPAMLGLDNPPVLSFKPAVVCLTGPSIFSFPPFRPPAIA